MFGKLNDDYCNSYTEHKYTVGVVGFIFKVYHKYAEH